MSAVAEARRRRTGVLRAGAVLSALLVGVPACGARAVPSARSSAESAPSSSPAREPAPAPSAATETRQECDLVCEGARVVPHQVPPSETADAYTTEAVGKANATLNGMHDDLLACYTTRVKAYPKAHAFLTIDIVVGPDGHVQQVETQGGALLGAAAMKCIVERIRGGEFAPPRGGGTMRFEVPFTLRRMGPDDVI